MNAAIAPPNGRGYEIKAVGLLAIGCGLVGLDRFIISPLFPVMAKDLGLSYRDFGLISGVLSLSWGLAALFAGSLADRLGPKRVLVPALLLFSLLVASTGLASGLGSLLALRGLMGFAEGAYMPAGIACTVEASAPRRVGLNLGLSQLAVGLFGLGLGPIIATQALRVLPSWHGVFALVALPGLVLAVLLQSVLRRPRPADEAGAHRVARPDLAERTRTWIAAGRDRNVLCAMLAMTCWMSANIVFAAFLPNYLTDVLKLDLQSMGYVLSAVGAGALVGVIGLSALSDRFAARPVLAVTAALLLPTLWLFGHAGANPARLFGLLFVWALLNTGAVAVTLGRLTVDSVSADKTATATGLVMGVGEIVGGAIMPVVAGIAVQAFGLPVILDFAMGAAAIGLLVCVFGLRTRTRPGLGQPKPAIVRAR
jgi:predicted MFS family arabinose efflux permease